MSILMRKKRLIGGKYNIQIVEITDHVSKKNDEGLLIRFKIQGEAQIYITRISKKIFSLIDKLVDVLCGTEEEISYKDAVGRMCTFTIEINGDFINIVDISKLEDTVMEDDSIYDNSKLEDFDLEDFDSVDFDPIDFDEEEDLI